MSPAERALLVAFTALLLAEAAVASRTGGPVIPAAPGPVDSRAGLAEAQRDLAAVEAAHGPSSLETAAALHRMAFLEWGVADYQAGRPIAERALALRLALGAGAHDRAASLYLAGEFRRATRDFAGALDAYRRALDAWALLPDEEETASAAWHYMGVVHGVLGDAAASRRCLERALAVRERTLGPRDPKVAQTLQALASLAQQQGDPGAEKLYARAQEIWEAAFGPSHPFIARSLIARASILSASGDFARAARLLDRAMAIRVAAFGADHHLVAHLHRVKADLFAAEGDAGSAAREYGDALDGLRRALGPEDPEVASALSALARLEWTMGKRRQAVTTALEAERIGRNQFLASARGLEDDPALRFAAVRTSGLDVALSSLADRPGGTDERRIVDALVRSRALVLDEPSTGGVAEAVQALPAGAVLLAYARYLRLPEGTASYLAVVIHPGADGDVVVPLGDAERIDALVAAWRSEAAADPRSRPGAAAEAAVRAAGTRLRAAIWDPIAAALRSARLALIVPDGALDLVSFAALPSGTDRFLLDEGPMFHYLTAERDLFAPAAGPPGQGLLVIGAPDFAAPAAGAAASAAQPTCAAFGALSFPPLPASAAEADEVTAAFGSAETVLLHGEGATASSFASQAPGRRILHLATHGYFLPAACAEVPAALEPEVLTEERQLLRSGLAFAGANAGGGAGVLNGEQIARLDLSGVEWVVLSGCDTGLGDLRAGEGLVGLRHAFRRAGAGTVITSLWGVDDGAARVFMHALYAARAAGGTTAEAMRQAAATLLAFQRREGRSTHPYYWGGFVAAGAWN